MSDLIDRQAAIEAIKEDKIDLTNPNVVTVFKVTGDFEKAETQVMTCDRHIKILKDLPSAQPEQKRGKWEMAYLDHVSVGNRPKVLYCSKCNQCIAYPTNYCPNCGADMREVSE